MRRYVAIRLMLPLFLLLLLAAGWFWVSHGEGVAIDSSARTLIASDPRNRETFEKLEDFIPETLVLVAMEMDAVFSDEGAALIDEVSERMLTVPGAVEVKSLTHSGRPVRRGFGLAIEPFIPLYASEAAWARLRDFNTRFPLSRNVLVSEDARHAILVGMYTWDFNTHEEREAMHAHFQRLLEDIEPRVAALHLLSFPFVEAEAYAAVEADLSRYLIAAGVLITLVLLVTFRSPLLVLYVFMLEVAGMLALGGIFMALNRSVNLYTGMLFPLVGGIQLTFAAHYLAAFQRSFQNLGVAPEAAEAAFHEVFRPSLVAAITTMAGLATLWISDLPMVRDFSLIGVLGVGAVFGLTFFFPALWLRSRLRQGSASAPDPGAPPLPVRKSKQVFLGFALLVLIMLPGMGRIRTDVRAVEFIAPGHPVRETLELLNHELGGINIFQLQVDTGTPHGLQQLPVLRYLEDLRAYALELDGVTGAYAYSQLYIALNQIWEGDAFDTLGLPETPGRILFFSNLLNASPLLFKDAFVDEQASSALMVLRSRDMPGREYLALLEDFMAYAEETKPPGVRLEPVQGLHSILEGDRQIVRNQTRTLGLSLAVIGVILSLLWRSPRTALMVLIANLPALVVLFGMMGWTGLPLNSVTVMVAAVILGIAVDDGIHLASHARAALLRGVSPSQAVSEALRAKFKPMACTSAILTVFLGLLMMGTFPPVAHFGLLGALGLATAFSGAVLLLPALLLKLRAS